MQDTTLSQTLRQRIVETTLPLNRLAREIGVPQPTLYRFVEEEKNIGLERAEKIAAYFGLALTPSK